MSNGNNIPNGTGEKGPKKSMNFYWIYALIGALLLAMLVFNNTGPSKTLSYKEFKERAENNEIKSFRENGVKAQIVLKDDAAKDSVDTNKGAITSP